MCRDSCSGLQGVPVNLMGGKRYETQPHFVTEILGIFYQDEVEKLCKIDAVIVNVDQKLWAKEKSKQEKKVKVRKSVMVPSRLYHLTVIKRFVI